MSPNGFLFVLVVRYVSLFVFIGFYKSCCVRIDSNGSFRVFIGPYASLCIFAVRCRSLCVLMGPCVPF